MIGTIRLELNEASIIEAVQEYLIKRMHAAPLVTDVTYSANCDAFIVTMDGNTVPAQVPVEHG